MNKRGKIAQKNGIIHKVGRGREREREREREGEGEGECHQRSSHRVMI